MRCLLPPEPTVLSKYSLNRAMILHTNDTINGRHIIDCLEQNTSHSVRA